VAKWEIHALAKVWIIGTSTNGGFFIAGYPVSAVSSSWIHDFRSVHWKFIWLSLFTPMDFSATPTNIEICPKIHSPPTHHLNFFTNPSIHHPIEPDTSPYFLI
jgi:hypothetical protein